MLNVDSYPIPAETVRVERRFVNSRFIGSAAHTPTVAGARDFIAQMRAEIPEATHHVYAYLVGYGASVTAGMSDAGEPSGTAGRPALAVLRGSGLGDVTVVITRFFGGTLLGTGGLVKAYGETTRAVLEALPRTQRIERRTLLIELAYSSYALAHKVLESHQAAFVDETFANDVTLMVELPVNQVEACMHELATVTAGQADIQLVQGACSPMTTRRP